MRRRFRNRRPRRARGRRVGRARRTGCAIESSLAPERPALAPSPPAGSSIMARRFTGERVGVRGEPRALLREAPHPNPLPGSRPSPRSTALAGESGPEALRAGESVEQEAKCLALREEAHFGRRPWRRRWCREPPSRAPACDGAPSPPARSRRTETPPGRGSGRLHPGRLHPFMASINSRRAGRRSRRRP